MIGYSCDNRSISLRNPDLGDSESIDLNFLMKRAMEGKLYTYLRGPVLRTKRFNFRILNREKIIELFDFLKFAAGKKSQLVDMDGTIYNGYILGDKYQSVDQVLSNHQVSIEFEYA